MLAGVATKAVKALSTTVAHCRQGQRVRRCGHLRCQSRQQHAVGQADHVAQQVGLLHGAPVVPAAQVRRFAQGSWRFVRYCWLHLQDRLLCWSTHISSARGPIGGPHRRRSTCAGIRKPVRTLQSPA